MTERTTLVRMAVGDRVATIALDRPEKLNAWTFPMEAQFYACVGEAAVDPNVGAIVITGRGRGFCAGLDRDVLRRKRENPGVAEIDRVDPPPTDSGHGGRFAFLAEIEKPVIAAVNGPAVGIGFVLAMCCDIRFSGRSATWRAGFVENRLVAEHGISWLLTHNIGVSRALDILWSSRSIDGAEALRLGLADRVVDDEALLPTVLAYASALACAYTPVLGAIKRQVWNDAQGSLTDAVISANSRMRRMFEQTLTQ